MADIMRSVYPLATGVEQALGELVTAGLVTADGFANLRFLLTPNRRTKSTRRQTTVKSTHNAGRWSLLPEYTADPQVRVEAACRLLLNRYGVLFRELLTREMHVPPWRELRPCLQRLEARGEIRGGRFVSGFFGEQFALPNVVVSLRAYRDKTLEHQGITLSVSDPLNLQGIILPGERVSAIVNKTLLI